MKKGKICSKLKKMLITVMCAIILVVSMPVKANASIIGDFLDLLLRIPDAVMWVANRYIIGTDITTSIDIDFKGGGGKGYIYNFEMTPYAIFTSGMDVGEKPTFNWGAKGNQYDEIANALASDQAMVADVFNVKDGTTVYEIDNVNLNSSVWDSYFTSDFNDDNTISNPEDEYNGVTFAGFRNRSFL